MSRRTAEPSKIKTLADWAARWPETKNLGFDPETREATIYSTTKERTKVSSIPWKREADTITVLSQPTRFSAQAVTAATSRYTKIQEQNNQTRQAIESQLKVAETALLDAWRSYYATPKAARGPQQHSILSAERVLRELEESMANKERTTGELANGSVFVYTPPMPVSRRGISMVDSA